MILLTRLDKQSFFINPDHIVSIEETPDTVITLLNGHHFIVFERASDIISKIVAFRIRILRRSNSSTGRRYLDKGKKRQFRKLTLNTEIQQLDACKDHGCAPPHFPEL